MHESSMYRWIVNRTNSEYIEYISKIASVSPTFAQILINRGIKTLDKIYSFLSPDVRKLSDPFDMPDIKIAVQRIKEALKLRQRVLVHGDYDVDGITATAVMYQGLRKFGLDVHYFIPNRMIHGYGFNLAGLQKAKDIGADLIITVDCGISSFEAVSRANTLGIDVIITDHHEPLRRSEVRSHESRISSEFLLPEALAIINPKLINYGPHLILSGAGVAFMLIMALFENNIDDVYEFLDLVALGTTADVVPVIEDNRIILKEGIKLIQDGYRKGIKALKEVAGIRSDFFKTSYLYFMINPRINSAGRIDDAKDVVRLLTTDLESESEELALWLNSLNQKRQEIEESVYNEAREFIERNYDTEKNAIVLFKEGWHPGVVGIVASRLAEEFYKPTFILSIKDGIAKGSARSIPDIDIFDALTQCKDILKRFGGHKQAAGLMLLSDDLSEFTDRINKIIKERLGEEEITPVLNIDAAVTLSDVNIKLVEEFSRLEPFGYGNDLPLLGAKGVEVINPRVVGNNHLKMYLRQNNSRMDSIGFDFGSYLDSIDYKIDIAFTPVINEWEKGRFLQLNIKAIRPAQF
jgi:single-stranded-DNA-specific exonuclease